MEEEDFTRVARQPESERRLTASQHEAIRAFLEKYDAVIKSDAYQSFIAIGWIHNGNYHGEHWTAELKALRASIRNPRSVSALPAETLAETAEKPQQSISPLPQGTAPQDLQALIQKWRDEATPPTNIYGDRDADRRRCINRLADELVAALSRPQGTETPARQLDENDLQKASRDALIIVIRDLEERLRAAVPPAASPQFVNQVRETWRALSKDHPDCRIRELFTCCPAVDVYAKTHGWPHALRAIAIGIEAAPPAPKETP